MLCLIVLHSYQCTTISVVHHLATISISFVLVPLIDRVEQKKVIVCLQSDLYGSVLKKKFYLNIPIFTSLLLGMYLVFSLGIWILSLFFFCFFSVCVCLFFAMSHCSSLWPLNGSQMAEDLHGNT